MERTPQPDQSESRGETVSTDSATAPHAANVPPIRATSHRRFGIIWLATLLCAVLLYPIIAFFWIKFYRSPDIAFSELLYRQKAVLVQRRASVPVRLFAVGGSGVLFGIDCELIEKKLGVHAINYGVYAGLGLGYMLDRVQRDLRAGDIVVLSPEYSCWGRNAEHSNDPAFQYIWTYDQRHFFDQPLTRMAQMIAEIRLGDWPDSAKAWMTFLHGKRWHFEDIVRYNVASVGQNGDLHVCLPERPIAKQFGYPFPDPSMPAVKTLQLFARTAENKGVRLLFTWPAFARPESPSVDAAPPSWLLDILRDGGFTMLDSPADNTFPPVWFQDTEYHVTPACRRLRTEELIRRLRPALGMPMAPDAPTAVLLVAARNHRLSAGNIFKDDPGVQVRVLTDGSISNPRAITASGVADLVRSGIPVYVDGDDHADAALAAGGLSLHPEASERVSVTDWFKKFPSHLFVLTAASTRSLDSSWKNVVPLEIDRALSANGAVAAVFGSGAYTGTTKLITGQSAARWESTLQKLIPGEHTMPATIQLESPAAGAATIGLDAGEFCRAGSGVCVAAIDPQLGTVVDSITFGTGPDVEAWRVDRVVLAK